MEDIRNDTSVVGLLRRLERVFLVAIVCETIKGTKEGYFIV